jgi:hypothetical protein
MFYTSRRVGGEEAHELPDDEFELALVTERRGGGLHALHIAVMVGAPQVDDVVEATVVLVIVVGDVGGEVGVRAVGLLKDAVLVVAPVGGTEPDGPVGVVHVTRVPQGCNGSFDRVRLALVQRVFAEPDVEVHTHVMQHPAQVIEHLGVGLLAEVVLPLDGIGVGPGRPLFVQDLAGDVEDIHLHARVIDVELPLHHVSRGLEEPGDAVTERGPAAVSYVHGAHGVRAHELDLDLATVTDTRVPVVSAESVDLPHDRPECVLAQPEVDEPWSGDLG